MVDHDDPDARNSRPAHDFRDGYGSVLWRYAKSVERYDPLSGNRLAELYPARQLMLVYAERWVNDFCIDGARLDSVENIANWDFVQQFRNKVRSDFAARRPAGAPAPDPRVLVVGEELSLPFELLRQARLDALWNQRFSTLIRSAVLNSGQGSLMK